MLQPQTLNIQYITDDNGKKTAVLIPIDQNSFLKKIAEEKNIEIQVLVN